MSYKKYKGPDKYHFRVYRKSVGHPFIVVTVSEKVDENGNILISGYMMTHSIERVIEKRGAYKRLKQNPNPSDDRLSFVNKYRINDIPASNFSRPYTNWHLSKDDEVLIDTLERLYSERHKK